MEIYLLLLILFPIIATRVLWVHSVHEKNEQLKSDYMQLFNDNTMRRRNKRSRFLDYFRIWAWMRVDFLKKEYKEKLN